MSAEQVIPSTTEHGERCRDVSGFVLFSTGAGGSAHVMAHRMLDQQRYEVGHELLGACLERRTGIGGDWVHLQWHMAVFELALNHWDAAFTRFREQILPTAGTTEMALTDAPALLWRLSLAASGPAELPWQPLRLTALARMRRPNSPYVELHNLLALAGAGDLVNLDQWLQRQESRARSRSEALVSRMAVALRAYAAGDFELAATVLTNVVPYIAEVGGSRAQNQLFTQLMRAAHRRACASDSLPSYLKVA
jgi:hypothetical protein